MSENVKTMPQMDDTFPNDIAEIYVPTNTFRLRVKTLHLTYPTHINLQDLYAHLDDRFPDSSNDLKAYSIINDKSPSGYLHTHALVKYKKKLDCKNSRKFDYDVKDTTNNVILTLHPNIRVIYNKTHFDNTLKYHYSKGVIVMTELNKPKESIPPRPPPPPFDPEEVWKCKDIHEAIKKHAHKAQDVSGIIKLYEYKPQPQQIVPKIITSSQFYSWQLELLQELNNPPDDRKVLWYVDPKGNTGKTSMLKYLRHHLNAFTYTIEDAKNVGQYLRNHHKKYGTAYTIVAIDIPKSSKNGENFNICTQAENFKNGEFSAPKYMSEIIFMPEVHVLIFSNYKPNIYGLSSDRWVIREIARQDQDVKVVVDYDVYSEPSDEETPVLITENTTTTTTTITTTTTTTRKVVTLYKRKKNRSHPPHHNHQDSEIIF